MFLALTYCLWVTDLPLPKNAGFRRESVTQIGWRRAAAQVS